MPLILKFSPGTKLIAAIAFQSSSSPALYLSTTNLQMDIAYGHVIPTTNLDCGGKAERRHRFAGRILTTKRQPFSKNAVASQRSAPMASRGLPTK
ncbi:MAG TPA: hypothetical protein VNX46_02415, partial [Candidatus Acidoferrum sp.]|nr:hypothetical protein [Candidatus Acidoferrum sp.]